MNINSYQIIILNVIYHNKELLNDRDVESHQYNIILQLTAGISGRKDLSEDI